MMPVFIGLTAVLVTLGLLIAQTVVAQREARERALSEGDTLIAFQSLLRTMLEAETSQRGYVLTADNSYLELYLGAKEQFAPAIADLRTAAAKGSDDETAARIDWIAGLTDAKFGEMDRTIALTRTGMREQARMIIDSDLGRQQMDAIRAAVASESARKARQRSEAFASAARFEQRLVPLIAILGAAMLALVLAGFRTERNRAQAEAAAEQADALRAANERAELLARELNHRVKNLFSVILSIVSLSGRKPGTPREVVESIRARIHALSLAHATSQGAAVDAGVELGPVIAKTMEPYADDEGLRVRLEGPQVALPARMVTPIGLIVHELATNAVKYGALSAPGGSVEICWRLLSDNGTDELVLRWAETGGPELSLAGSTPSSQGFGSQMTALAAHQLGGTIVREWPVSGATAELRLPLPQG